MKLIVYLTLLGSILQDMDNTANAFAMKPTGSQEMGGQGGRCWKVRPSTPKDKDAVEALLYASYSTMLSSDYDEQILATALPFICRANDQLLCSSTWYVVEAPSDDNDDSNKKEAEVPTLIGCGGWTPYSPFKEDIPNLRHFATHPDCVRRGVGKAIWERTWADWVDYHTAKVVSSRTHEEEEEEEEDERLMDLPPNIRPDMEVVSTLTATSFYESLGFVKVKDIIVQLTESCPFPSVLLRCPDTP